MEVGRVCIKTAGRDSNKYCIIIEVVDDRFAIVDGATRRKKVNILHLEPTAAKAGVKKGASHDECVKALRNLGFKVEEKQIRKKEKSQPKK